MLVPKSNFAQIFLGYSSNKGEHKAVVDFVANDLHAHPTGKIERELAEKILRTVLEDVANDQLAQNSRFSLYNSSLCRDLPHRRSTDLRSLLQSLGVMANILQSGDIFRNLFQRISITESWPDELISFVASRMVTDAQQTKASGSCVWEQW
jgi:hypothetical protein